MTTIPDSPCASRAPAQADGFDVLDICHRQTVLAIGKLAAHITRLSIHGPDDAARSLAAEILHHFVATARQHREDEERHVFPRLVASGDAELVQNVLRLQEDHDWLEEDWMEIPPHIAAVAHGHIGHDLDLLRAGAATFTALSHDHMAMEESCIYPQARAQRGARLRYAMSREMEEVSPLAETWRHTCHTPH